MRADEASRAADSVHLRECLDLAARARGRTSPNPMVGAVVVRDGAVVGRGFHRRAGEPHAERLALAEAGEAARGATLYTNMEPCSHHGRTPPCVEGILESGVARVVSSLQDPDPRVDGAGFAALREAGVAVQVGGLETEAWELNAGYLTLKREGRPFVVAKAALSLDGRMCTRTGSSQWITGPEARRHAHGWRASVDAVVVGSGTVLADDPSLTAREVDAPRQPAAVVLDTQLRTPATARLLHAADRDVVVVTRERADAGLAAPLEAAGARLVTVATGANGSVDPEATLAALADLGIGTVMLEAGPRVLTAFFEVGTIDRLLLYYGPLLIGGAEAPTLWQGTGVETIDRAPRLHRPNCTTLGADWLVDGYLRPLPIERGAGAD